MTEPTVAETEQVEELPSRTLDTTNRCDRCKSQAFIVVENANLARELYFCLHDYKTHAEELERQGWEVVLDETYKLTAKSDEVHG